MSISGRLLRAPKSCISGGRLLGCSARLASAARHANAEYMSSVPDSIAQIASGLRRERIADLFARDPARVEQLTFAWNDWRVDVSKERISHDALAALLAHAEALNLPHWIAALFSGEKLNLSEPRPALHTALRAARRRADRRRRPRRHACGPRDAGAHAAAVRRRCASTGGAARPASRSRARQSRHRRLGPRSAPRAATHCRPGKTTAGRGRVRVERRSRATVADARPARSGDDAVRRHVEDVHDPGDARQCDSRARVAARPR